MPCVCTCVHVSACACVRQCAHAHVYVRACVNVDVIPCVRMCVSARRPRKHRLGLRLPRAPRGTRLSPSSLPTGPFPWLKLFSGGGGWAAARPRPVPPRTVWCAGGGAPWPPARGGPRNQGAGWARASPAARAARALPWPLCAGGGPAGRCRWRPGRPRSGEPPGFLEGQAWRASQWPGSTPLGVRGGLSAQPPREGRELWGPGRQLGMWGALQSPQHLRPHTGTRL